MGKFIKILDGNYKFWQQMECAPESKIEYIGNVIFDFTTYDSAVDILFAKRMMPVLKCILERKSFEYQKGKRQ